MPPGAAILGAEIGWATAASAVLGGEAGVRVRSLCCAMSGHMVEPIQAAPAAAFIRWSAL